MDRREGGEGWREAKCLERDEGRKQKKKKRSEMEALTAKNVDRRDIRHMKEEHHLHNG